MPDHYGGKRSFIILKYFNFFVYGAISILLSYFPLYFEHVGLNTVQIGLLMAGGPFISIFANPFWGYWSDRSQNIRRIIMILLFGNLLITQAVFQLHTYVLIYAVMLVFFFFQSPLFAQSNSLILNAIEGTRYGFGTFRLWGSLGWALMAVLAGPVIGWIGISDLWIIYSVMLMVAIAFSWGLPRGEIVKKKDRKRGNYFQVIFANKLFFVFLILGVLISVPNSINQTFVSLYIAKLGGSEALVGWSAFLAAIFEVPIFLLFDRYLKHKTTIMIGCLVIVSLLFAGRWFLMSMAVSPIHIVFLQVLHCITFGGFYYIGTSLTAHTIPGQMRATGQAVYTLTWTGISGVLAGVFGGWMFQALGPKMMYEVGAIISLVAVLGFSLMWRQIVKRKQQTRLPDTERDVTV